MKKDMMEVREDDQIGTATGLLGVSKNRGIPKWMVYDGKPY